MDDLFIEYDILADNDPETAYSLMKQASSLLSTEEASEARLDKELNRLKTLAEAIEAEICLKSGSSVAKGEKEASCDDRVIRALELYYDAKCIHGEKVAMIKYLWRIYYDTKEIWQQGRQNLKHGRDS